MTRQSTRCDCGFRLDSEAAAVATAGALASAAVWAKRHPGFARWLNRNPRSAWSKDRFGRIDCPLCGRAFTGIFDRRRPPEFLDTLYLHSGHGDCGGPTPEDAPTRDVTVAEVLERFINTNGRAALAEALPVNLVGKPAPGVRFLHDPRSGMWRAQVTIPDRHSNKPLCVSGEGSTREMAAAGLVLQRDQIGRLLAERPAMLEAWEETVRLLQLGVYRPESGDELSASPAARRRQRHGRPTLAAERGDS